MSDEPLYTYVVAGDYRQFINWCRANGKHPMDRFIQYVTDVTKLKGLDPNVVEFELTGTWYERPDMREIGHEIDMIRTKRG